MIAGQKNLTAGGHIAGRDINAPSLHFHGANAKSQISLLYERLRSEAVSSDGPVSEIIEDLQHYLGRPGKRMDRSLEEKLLATKRDNLVDVALEAKERAMKRIMKFQSSLAAQEIFAWVLGDIHARFTQHILPLLAISADRQVVDSAVFELVVSPIAAEMEPSELGLNTGQIMAMLYCLAGNCHIKWD